MSNTADFYSRQQEHSKVKSEIVARSFIGWLSVVKQFGSGEIRYVDVFSGPGIYEDGMKSTPLMILDKLEGVTDVWNRILLEFYEKDENFCDTLQDNIRRHKVTSSLKHKPIVHNVEVTTDLLKQLSHSLNNKSFCFVDPFGYQPISAEAISHMTRGWGNDCIFYLSIDGIRRNTPIPEQRKALVELFGEGGYDKLLEVVAGNDVSDSFHASVMKLLCAELETKRGQQMYFLPFAMEKEGASRVTHYLCGLSKHHRGFVKMKEAMYSQSHRDALDIPSWTFKPLWDSQLELPLSTSLDSLCSRIADDFGGSEWLVKYLVDAAHKKGYLYVEKNIKDALLKMESLGRLKRIVCAGKKYRSDRMSDSQRVKIK